MDICDISHVSQFVQFIEENSAKYLRDQHFLYRGESDIGYKPLPSVFRKKDAGLGHEIDLYKYSEQAILGDFMTESASFVNYLPVDDVFRWIQYAQHFGAPTRLLDWTSNPLVALFFACSSNPKKDGKIYILNSLGYQLLAAENSMNYMDGKLIKEEAYKMIWNSEETFPYPIPFRPYCFDRRMLAQSSQFMVWGYKKKSLDDLIVEMESGGKKKEIIEYLDISGVTIESLTEIEILTKIHILAKHKIQLQEELDRIGINHATLFPGLDGIGKAVEWRSRSSNMK